uniref:THAP4-like heme-binding beta-barrel domain-containing protein n=1 Tax=Trichuris muris TaxID=70415 RepID=A0A5S6R5I0_TRIMR
MLVLWPLCTLLLQGDFAIAQINAKYDVRRLPLDLRPVGHFLGRWQAYRTIGRGERAFPTGQILDFGIDPLPVFGARSLNYTATTRNPDGTIVHFEYGFLMVKNRTRTNPQILCGLITTCNKGYSLVEFGMVQDGFVDLELNNFITRSFDQRYNVYELRRNLYLYAGDLKQDIEARTNTGNAAYSVMYRKISS